MKKVVLIAMIVAFIRLCRASQSPSLSLFALLEIFSEERSQQNYNPFREGLIIQKVFDTPGFFPFYAEVQPEILEYLGSEIKNFYLNNPESTATAIVHRYMYSIAIRLCMKRSGSRKIDVVQYSIPAHYDELKLILNEASMIERTADHNVLHQELHSYFEVLRQHARDQENFKIVSRFGENQPERTAHEKHVHYLPS